LRARRLEPAATLALRTYGPELYGFLASQLGNEADTGEVFSQLTEDLWRGLPGFEWRCSLRTWLYLLARHATSRFRSSPWNRGGRTGDSKLDAQIAEVRSHTEPWLRTEVKDRLRRLRDSLAPDDRLLLTLRLDRQLAWNEVALVTLGESAGGLGWAPGRPDAKPWRTPHEADSWGEGACGRRGRPRRDRGPLTPPSRSY